MEKITISLVEYLDLRKRDYELQLLENGGVDNWEWYADSLNQEESYSDIMNNLEEKIIKKYKENRNS